MRKKPGEPSQRAEEAFRFFASLPPERRKYAAVAAQFGVSLATVRLWGSKGSWQRRVLEKEIQTVRRTADRVATADIDTRTRHAKLVELGLIKLANAIARGEVKPTYGDLDRLVRLEGALTGTDKTMPLHEVQRIFEYFLRAIEQEIHDPEQRQRIAGAVRDAIEAAQAPRRLGTGRSG